MLSTISAVEFRGGWLTHWASLAMRRRIIRCAFFRNIWYGIVSPGSKLLENRMLTSWFYSCKEC